MPYLDDTVVRFNYDQLQAYDDDDISLYCLSDRDLSIVLSCLRYATWAARWYDDNNERLRDVGRGVDLEDAITRSERLISRLMSDKCADLGATFEALVEAMGNIGSGAGCGCGAGGAGGTDPPASGSSWGDPEDPPDPLDPPDGFDDWDEYRAYKCDVATWILESVISDVQWIQTVDIAGLTVTALAFGLLTPIPGDELFALLAGLLASLAISTGAIGVIEAALIDDYDDILCALYRSESASQAKTDTLAAIGVAIDGETADVALRAMLKLTAGFWVNYVGINKMFDRDVTFETQLPTGDCSSCGIPQWWECSNGGVVDWGDDWVEFLGAPVGSDYLVSVGSLTNPGFEATVVDGFWSAPTVPTFATAVENGGVLFCGSGNGSPWDLMQAGFNGGPHASATTVQFRSGSQFTVRFTQV